MFEFVRQVIFFIYYKKSHHEEIERCRSEVIRTFIASDENFSYLEYLICFQSSVVFVYNCVFHRQELKISKDNHRIRIHEKKIY